MFKNIAARNCHQGRCQLTTDRLIPHQGNLFTKAIQELISDTIPRNFSAETHDFIPHVTLTSDVDTDKVLGGKSPQDWLDGLELPDWKPQHDEVIVELDTVEAEEPFFRKMNISVKDNANLKTLASICRREGVQQSEDEAKAWAEKEYRPHMSLLYADVSQQEAQSKVPLIEM